MTRAERVKAWHEAHPERVREHKRKSRVKRRAENGDEIRAKECARLQKWNSANPERRRELNRIAGLRRYGLTVADYERMKDEQGGGCAICKRDEVASLFNRLYVDHDHVTGVVRGLLCYRCNAALGQFGDDLAGVSTVVRYLMKSVVCKDVA